MDSETPQERRRREKAQQEEAEAAAAADFLGDVNLGGTSRWSDTLGEGGVQEKDEAERMTRG